MAKIETIFRLGAGRCKYCERGVMIGLRLSPYRATIDHDVPKVRGGTNDSMNLVLACVVCNEAKSDMTGLEFRHFLCTLRLPESYVRYLGEAKAKRLRNRREGYEASPLTPAFGENGANLAAE